MRSSATFRGIPFAEAMLAYIEDTKDSVTSTLIGMLRLVVDFVKALASLSTYLHIERWSSL